MVVVSYKGKYVHGVLVNRLVKLAREKMWLCELTVSAIAVDLDIKPQTKPNHMSFLFPSKQSFRGYTVFSLFVIPSFRSAPLLFADPEDRFSHV